MSVCAREFKCSSNRATVIETFFKLGKQLRKRTRQWSTTNRKTKLSTAFRLSVRRRPLVSTFSSLISIFNSHKQSLAACSLFLLDKKNGSHVNKVNEAFR